MRLVSASEMRRLDELTIQQYGRPGIKLMERAGAGAVEVLLAQFPHVRRRRVVVVAGKGNNGGDGFVMARLLRRAGVRAEVVLLGEAAQVKGDAALALAAMRRAKVPFKEFGRDPLSLVDRLEGAALVVDAIFGTGLNAQVTGLQAEAIEAMNACGVPIFAVDIPSGLNADSGTALGACIQAEATATFGFAKLGQVMHPGVDAVGALAVVDIGIADEAIADVPAQSWLLEADGVAPLVPTRAADSHKGSHGHLLVLAGSKGHTGAARIAAHAACRTGAGLTSLAGPQSLGGVFATAIPEVMTLGLADNDGVVSFDAGAARAALAGKSAIVVGPGLSAHSDAELLVKFCVSATDRPMVLDADALTCISRDLAALRPGRGRIVLTPHPGEMARLLGCEVSRVQADRVAIAREFANTHGCVLVLKGARTVIASANGDIWINPTGNPGMASGGMGDALAGIIGAFLAQGLSPVDAAKLGVFVHGAAADRLAQSYAPVGYTASDVINEVPRCLAVLRQSLVTAVPPVVVKRRR